MNNDHEIKIYHLPMSMSHLLYLHQRMGFAGYWLNHLFEKMGMYDVYPNHNTM